MNAKVFILFVTAVISSRAAFALDAQEVFSANCASCHGADGKGRTPAGKKIQAKDLTESKLADADIEKQITNGTRDAKGSPRMPSFKAKLSTDEISALVVFVKTLRH